MNETIGLRMSRYANAEDGSLGPRQTVTEFGPGSFPDGLSFDVEGGAWMTCVITNEVIRVVTATGEQQLIVSDRRQEHVDAILSVYDTGRFAGWADALGSVLRNPTSVTFGGSDLHDVYLGFLQGDRLARFRSAIAGAEPPHLRFYSSRGNDEL